MKQGKSLTELAQEIERQTAMKRDFIADTRTLKMVPVLTHGYEHPDDVCLDMTTPESESGIRRFKPTALAHKQIAESVKIPVRYYERMKDEAPELLARNVNHWFQEAPEPRMIRTLDNQARAFLSNRYRRLDNYDLIRSAILPVLETQGDLRIESSEITETRLYIKITTPRLTGEVKKGDVVQAGIAISNSEVGYGRLMIDPFINRLICENGMVARDRSGKDFGLSKYHIGRQLGAGEEAAAELLTDETQEAIDRAFWLEARDVMKGLLSMEVFNQVLGDLKAGTENRITGDPVAAVKELANRYRLTEQEESGIRTQLIQHEEQTQYGLLNAITRYSQEVESYDRATELERLGGEIITLSPKDWKPIAEAAA